MLRMVQNKIKLKACFMIKTFALHKLQSKAFVLCKSILLLILLSSFDDIADDELRYKSFAENTQVVFEKAKRFDQQGNEDSALAYYGIINNRWKQNNTNQNARYTAMSLLRSGVINYERFDYSEAMRCLMRSLYISEQHGYDDLLTEVYKNIGNIYSQFEDFGWSLRYYKKSYELCIKTKNYDLEQKVLYNMSVASILSGNVKQAEAYYQKMVKTKSNTQIKKFDMAIVGGLLNEVRGKLQNALEQYKKATDIASRQKLKATDLGSAQSSISRVLRKQRNLNGALRYLKLNENLATKEKQNDMLASTYRDLSSLYKEMGKREPSLEYMKLYLDTEDAIFSKNSYNSIKNAQFQYEQERNGEQIDQFLREKAIRSRQLRLQLIAIICSMVFTSFLIIATIIIWKQKRKLSESYADIYERNLKLIENERQYRRRIDESELKLKKIQEAIAKEYAPDNSKMSSFAGHTTNNHELVVLRIRNVMEHGAEYLSTDFSINKLAQLVGSTPQAVSQIINEDYGQNFRTFLNELRIKEAMSRLSNIKDYGNYTIQAIAESVGYKSQSNFISVFTRISGIKPSVFKKLAMEKNSKGLIDAKREDIG